MPNLSYSQLSAILCELGFERRVIRGSHVLFKHQLTDTIMMFPITRGNEKVRMANIVSTQFMLDAKGIADRQQWEKLVQRRGDTCK